MIEIYIHALGDEPHDSFPYEGNLLSLFEAHFPEGKGFTDFDQWPFEVRVNGGVCAPSKWAQTEIAGDDVVAITAIPNGGVFKLIGSLLGGVFKLLFPFLTPNNQGSSGRAGAPQGQALEAADLRANQARMGDIVPIMIGRCRRYGDYLNEPVKRFVNRREQYLSFLVCLSAESVNFSLSDVYVGETPITQIPGAEVWNHYPGASLLGHEPAELWHNVDAVGGTSSGTAGIVLSADVSNAVNIDPGDGYFFNGLSVSRNSGSFPGNWGLGTKVKVTYPSTYAVGQDTIGGGDDPQYFRTYIQGFFGHMDPLTLSVSYQGDVYKAVVLSDLGGGYKKIGYYSSTNLRWYDEYPIPGFTNPRTYGAEVEWEILTISPTSITFVNNGFFFESTHQNPDAKIVFSSLIYGDYSSPYIGTPAGQKTQIAEVDLFLPQGLRYSDDEGNPTPQSVTVDIEFSDADGIVPTVVLRRVYTDATPDQIGFTERHFYPSPARAQVRVRRVGNLSSDPRRVDEINWYGFRTRMTDRNSYPWHTMSIRIRSGGQIGAQAENKINVIGTGYGPELLPNGSWSAGTPTSQLASALYRVATTSGYTAADFHSDLLYLSENYWKPRGETFGFVMDGGTVKDALDTILQCGLSELTMEDGFLRPVRDVPRSIFEQGYSPLNITSKSVSVRFNNHRSDDPDGVLVEYLDSTTWETETIQCAIPGDEFRRPRRVKLRGCTRTVAYQYGMRIRLAQEYRRTSYEFDTELDAMNSSYRSYISVIDSLRNYGQAAMAEHIEFIGQQAIITSSEKLEFVSGQNYVLALRDAIGNIVGPFSVSSISADGYTVTINTQGAALPAINRQQELPHLYFGQNQQWNYPALVESIQPSNGLNVRVRAINYDARVYAYDNTIPGAI